MSGYHFQSPWFIRDALDTILKFTNPGLPVYLRIKNVVDKETERAQLGYQWTPQGSEEKGYEDIEIDPPPSVEKMSFHNIGVSDRLNFGAHQFEISHTFVMKRMRDCNYSDPYDVFRSDDVIGLVYNNRLWSMESVDPETVGDEIISWRITSNALEKALS